MNNTKMIATNLLFSSFAFLLPFALAYPLSLNHSFLCFWLSQECPNFNFCSSYFLSPLIKLLLSLNAFKRLFLIGVYNFYFKTPQQWKARHRCHNKLSLKILPLRSAITNTLVQMIASHQQRLCCSAILPTKKYHHQRLKPRKKAQLSSVHLHQ